jgi:hypothetical protein
VPAYGFFPLGLSDDPALAHRPDERLSLEGMSRSLHVLEAVADRVANDPGTDAAVAQAAQSHEEEAHDE